MHRANVRERLKTKSGCLTCRRRKKKCDETVPACGACQRNKWPCLWPGKTTVAESVLVIPPLDGHLDQPGEIEIVTWKEPFPSISPLTATKGSTSTPRPLFLKPGYILSNYFFQEGFLLLLRPDVNLGFAQDLCANTLSIGAAYPCAMDLFLAFSALCMSFKHPDVIPFALNHYAAATSSAISRIQDATVNGSEDWLLTMACVMCVFERAYPDLSYNPTLHIQAAAQMMLRRRTKSSPKSAQLASPFHRILSEAILYNTVITACFADDAKLFACQNLFSEFGDDLDVSPFPDASHEDNSPLLLGVSRHLFRLVLDLSCLARQAADRPKVLALAPNLQEKIDFWLMESESKMGSESLRIGRPECDCSKEAMLYSLAADIILLKIRIPETQSNHPQIRYRVKQALEILMNDENQHMYLIQQRCWPLTVIGCALSEEEDVVFLRERLESSWKFAFLGEVKRTLCILEKIWNLRPANTQLNDRAPSQSCITGVDLLLQKDGLSIFLDQSI